MSQSVGREDEHFPSTSSVSPEKGRPLQGTARTGQNGAAPGHVGSSAHINASPNETPFGAVHVDASGVVLEHRPLEACGASVLMQPIIGQTLRSVAAWASEPDVLSALKSAIDSAKVSFHFDFRTVTGPRERLIHVNILAVGDGTAWIFISDKTLAVVAS